MFEKNEKNKYDLEDRTGRLGKRVIEFCKKIPKNEITRPLINQLVKCGTSVGANYCEADDAESKKDFKHKIGICKKEARECKHFLKMMIIAIPEYEKEAKEIQKEANELNLIFNSIYNKVNNN